VSNDVFVTQDRFLALEHYDKECLVYEHHVTKSKPSQFVQAEQKIALNWNNNPEFEEGQDEHC